MLPNSSLSIKTQLYALLALLLLLMGISVGIALRYLATQNDKNDRITDVVAERVIVSQELIVSLLESARHIRNTLILDDTALIKQELFSLDQQIKKRRDHLETLKNLSDDPNTKRLLRDIIDSRALYLPLEQDFTKMIEAGDFKGAREQLLAKSRPAQLDYLSKVYKYIEPARQELSTSSHATTVEMEAVRRQVLLLGALTIALGAFAGWWVLRNLLGQLGGEPQLAVQVANRIAEGDRQVEVNVAPGDRTSLMFALQSMADALTRSHQSNERSDWIKTGLADLSLITRREILPSQLALEILYYLMQRLHGVVGVVYFYNASSRRLERVVSQGLLDDNSDLQAFELGQGLVGQAGELQQLNVLSPLPAGYLQVNSGTGSATPESLLLLPLADLSGPVAVLEIGAFQPFDSISLEFCELAREGLGLGLGSALSRQRTHELLATLQTQSEQLQCQQEELEQSNDELREHAQVLDAQRRELDQRNIELRDSSAEIEWRAQELERVSRYKSEFLANMSHELRTPLNSILMLSALLQDNREQTLTEKQGKFANSIHAAGQDLLSLINDILDLSKIEAGQVEYLLEPHSVDELCAPLLQMFSQLAQQKGLQLEFSHTDNLPELLNLDLRRTQQILKNLLSNALKFTSQGRVELKIFTLEATVSPLHLPTLAMAVSDSGIGIELDKQSLVFEAFKQADGGISRSYGGTGLGLSISRQLALGLQGQLTLQSELGQGSTFTLLLPLQAAASPAVELATESTVAEPVATSASLLSPRIQNGRQILIVEDDANFQATLLDHCQQRGFTTLSAADGETALALARSHMPAAILLDVMMPKLNGWEVMRHLQSDAMTAQIPVHFITALDERARALELGAASFANKPISVEQLDALLLRVEQTMQSAYRRILIVEDNPLEAYALSEQLSDPSLRIEIAQSGNQALRCLQEKQFDAMILDLGLQDIQGEDLLVQIRAQFSADQLPVLVHSGHSISRAQERSLLRLAQTLIVKGEYSSARIRQELQTLLENGKEQHLPTNAQLDTQPVTQESSPMPAQKTSASAERLSNLNGRTVLVADDDIRNLFAISSLLSYHDMRLIEAENGREAIDLLAKNPQVELVLMDIMMPEMDGYSAIRAIRANSDLPMQADLPIIAMTAKTMPGDRELCLAAGASDYIAKPLDNEQLLMMLQKWLEAKERNISND